MPSMDTMLRNSLLIKALIVVTYIYFQDVVTHCMKCNAQQFEATFDKNIANYTLPKLSPELRGGDYKPSGVILKPGLANWNLLAYFRPDEFVVKNIRLYGFADCFEGRCLDWQTDNKTVTTNIRTGLHSSKVRRPCVSDLSSGRGQVGPGAHLGVLVVESEREPLIIGVSQVGFYLGTSHGTTHQEFHSCILAGTLDSLLFELSGKHLRPEILSRLSGEYFVREGQKYLMHANNKDNSQ
jgi:hypothetical protein